MNEAYILELEIEELEIKSLGIECYVVRYKTDDEESSSIHVK